MPTPTPSLIEVNSTRLHHEVRGTGPTLLFVPGALVDSAHFTAVADLLADEFRTVVYDRRGTGDSPRPPGWHSTSMAEQADDVAGLIDMLGLAPCVVWSSSLGSVVLLELLARRPGLVRTAVLHEPALFGVLDDGDRVAGGLMRSAGTAVREHAVGTAFAEHVRAALGNDFDRLTPQLRARMAANADVFFDLEVPALVNSFPDMASVSRVLDTVDVPLLFLADPAGRETPPFQATHRLAAHMGSKVHELPGGHMSYATDPQITAAMTRALLRG